MVRVRYCKFCIKITDVFCDFLKDIQKVGNSVVLSYILKKADVLSLHSMLLFKPIWTHCALHMCIVQYYMVYVLAVLILVFFIHFRFGKA